MPIAGITIVTLSIIAAAGICKVSNMISEAEYQHWQQQIRAEHRKQYKEQGR
jgi:hypothetical protein